MNLLKADSKLKKDGTPRKPVHPNSLKNLRSDANLNGRPPNGFSIVSRQKEMLQEVCPFDAQGRTWLEAIAEAGLRMSLQKPEAFRDLLDRHAGKVTLVVGGDTEHPLPTPTFFFLAPDGTKIGAKEKAGV